WRLYAAGMIGVRTADKWSVAGLVYPWCDRANGTFARGIVEIGAPVGAWGEGPFDNDEAADWCDNLDEADPAARAGLIRTGLEVTAWNKGYLHCTDATSAIAAAAIVASRMPGGSPITSPYAPDFLLAGQGLGLDDDLAELGVRALDRVVGDDSEWRDMWNAG